MVAKKCPRCEEWFTQTKANGYDYRGDIITHLIGKHGCTVEEAKGESQSVE